MAVAAACFAAVIDWPFLKEQASDAGEKTAAAASSLPQQQVKAPAVRPFAGRGLNARLMRAAAPELPVALSEEGKRMVKDMLNVYRCSHSGSKRALPPSLDGASLVAGMKPDAVTQSLGTMPDACYVNAALGRIANPESSSAELDVLFDDLLKRPDALKLRMLFVIASIESHPKAAEALAQLRGLIGTDWEQDWARWEQAVTQLAVRELRGIRIASCRSR